MKGLHLAELRELLHGTAFAAWWSDWQRAGAEEAEARAREEELTAQAGLLVVRARLADRAGAEAREHAEALIAEAQQLLAQAGHGSPREPELLLLAAERRAAVRRAHAEVERRAAESSARRARARSFEVEARAARAARQAGAALRRELLERARQLLGCVPGEAFLYWPHPDDPQHAYALALSDGASPEVKPLTVWSVDPRHGPDALEPPRDGSAPERREASER